VIAPFKVNGWTISQRDGAYYAGDQATSKGFVWLAQAIEYAQKNPHPTVTHPGPADAVVQAQGRVQELSGSMMPGADIDRRLLLRLINRVRNAENTMGRGVPR